MLWALSDHQGSVRDVVDSEGTVLNHLTYDSYGQVTSETNPEVDFRFGYTGRERDEETGLYYYRARYFDPAVGTFISEDPLGFAAGDSNIYRYVFNSPTNYTDPSGLLTLYRGNPFRDVLTISGHPGTSAVVPLFDRYAPQFVRDYGVDLSFNAGEGYAESAQQFWAERFVDESRPWYERADAFAAGMFASLWVCDNSDITAATLGTALSVARPAANTRVRDLLPDAPVVHAHTGSSNPGRANTGQRIQDALENSNLRTQQERISVPRVERYEQLYREGVDMGLIKVDNGMIVDGHHRYIASQLAGVEPRIVPGTRPSFKQSLPSKPINRMILDPNDY